MNGARTRRTFTIRNRETREIGTVIDITSMSDREVARLHEGLVLKVDFSKWALEDSDDPDSIPGGA